MSPGIRYSSVFLNGWSPRCGDNIIKILSFGRKWYYRLRLDWNTFDRFLQRLRNHKLACRISLAILIPGHTLSWLYDADFTLCVCFNIFFKSFWILGNYGPGIIMDGNNAFGTQHAG